MDLDKLLETGDRCIHSEPPACTASCPVHLDVEAFVTEIEQGNFKNAYKLMEKKIPFAGIIGMICDHPCEDICVRQDAGGAVGISEMEKAANELPIEQVAKRWIVSSDPDEAVEKVGDYVKYGLNHLVFHAPGHDQRRFLELFEKDLAPRLRKLG